MPLQPSRPGKCEQALGEQDPHRLLSKWVQHVCVWKEGELLVTVSSQMAKKSSRVDIKASKEDLKDMIMEKGWDREPSSQVPAHMA